VEFALLEAIGVGNRVPDSEEEVGVDAIGVSGKPQTVNPPQIINSTTVHSSNLFVNLVITLPQLPNLYPAILLN
jgi:hypothetical protein